MPAPEAIRVLAWRGGAFLGLGLFFSSFLPASGSAQIISPGRLSRPHAELSGITSCTQCHEIGRQGIAPERCLQCHVLVSARIRRGEGFHATADSMATSCASCHREHFGEDFQLVRFDTIAFDHATVGYALDGAHVEASCRACHAPELISDRAVRDYMSRNEALDRTYLGLPTACVTCHGADDPHAGQFADRSCTACHTTRSWEEAPAFDHEATRYPLTGRHAALECASCHRGVREVGRAETFTRYTPLSFASCTSCHEDPHAGAMEGSCSSCHGTAGWERVDPSDVEGRFAHESTGFTLEGAHGRATCASCHDPAASRSEELHLSYLASVSVQPFPSPVAEECVSCHVDAHGGMLADLPGGATCTNCHGQDQWLPASYGLARHNAETRFPLEGAHLTVPCEGCHRTEAGELELQPAFDACTACHREDDPHEGQFADRRCETCHTVASFEISDFDHSATKFPLEGGHEDVDCASCHRAEETPAGVAFVRYAPLGTACTDCHLEEPR